MAPAVVLMLYDERCHLKREVSNNTAWRPWGGQDTYSKGHNTSVGWLLYLHILVDEVMTTCTKIKQWLKYTQTGA